MVIRGREDVGVEGIRIDLEKESTPVNEQKESRTIVFVWYVLERRKLEIQRLSLFGLAPAGLAFTFLCYCSSSFYGLPLISYLY